jgi:hypothetical protein
MRFPSLTIRESASPLSATLRGRLTHRQQIREFQEANLCVGSGRACKC